jgi:uncharacterized protein (TIGR01244 family)
MAACCAARNAELAVPSSPVTLLVCLLLATSAGAQQSPLSETLVAVSDNVMLAGALSPDAATQLHGTATVVIDLRTAAEGTAEESHALWRAGVTYINLPTTGAVPNPADVELFDSIIAANAGRPILVHCASGNRAGLLWAAHLLDTGASLPQARQAVAQVVTKAPVEAAIDGYAAQRSGAVVE